MSARLVQICLGLLLLAGALLWGCAPQGGERESGRKEEPPDEVTFTATVRSIEYINQYQGKAVRYLRGVDEFVLTLELEGAPPQAPLKPRLNAFAIHSPIKLFGGCRLPPLDSQDIRRPEIWGMKFAFTLRKVGEDYWRLEARGP